MTVQVTFSVHGGVVRDPEYRAYGPSNTGSSEEKSTGFNVCTEESGFFIYGKASNTWITKKDFTSAPN